MRKCKCGAKIGEYEIKNYDGRCTNCELGYIQLNQMQELTQSQRLSVYGKWDGVCFSQPRSSVTQNHRIRPGYR